MNKPFKLFWTMLFCISVFVTYSICGSAKDKLPAENGSKYNGSSAVKNDQNAKTYEMKDRKETQHFVISYFGTDFGTDDQKCLAAIVDSLESGYTRVTAEYQPKLAQIIEVEIHKDMKELHLAMGIPDAPDWAGGGYSYSSNRITSASPLLTVPGFDYNGLINTPLHEYVHLVVQAINPATPRWLNEGIAVFESKDKSIQWVRYAVISGVYHNQVPSFDDLDTGNDYQEFALRSGYQYMYTFIEFVTKTYGYAKLRQFIKTPVDFEGAFGLSKDALWNQWVAYLKQNYNLT